ncbi:MAG: enoyl-CoA hydratase/isomerase family protein [Burkholderiales bacterium]|jgi:enoyl-CoA hydratase/carnithine racemase|nr:enoyl-CoA hydratase/isomerase family protein [Burkholderiales bacterium]
MPSLVTYTVADGVAEIVMSRAPVNAIDLRLAREVIDAYHRARADPEARAVILTSSLPTVFSAGLDLKLALDFDGQALRSFIEVFYYEMHEALYRLGKPVIAAVNGHARAAGMTWAVSCDMIIAAEEAKMGYPEIDVGLLPAMHLVHLPRQIGRHRAAQLLFTGDIVDAAEMHRLGVVNEVLPRDQVVPRARALARRLARKSPVAMKLLRDAFMRANDSDYRRSMEGVVETMCSLKDSADSREALMAFVEKREAVYRGR